MSENSVVVDGHEVEIEGERNLLELIRKIGIDIPTFCYHSDLSIYGACRLCLVDVEGRGIMASCSTAPQPGMNIKTNTEEIRTIRKATIELLLANHCRECPTCTRSSFCTLQDLGRRLGVEDVRYKSIQELKPLDETTPSLTRDPNKCVLCGDCVRVCAEVQGIGAIDFTGRGAEAAVEPALGRGLGEVECVNCGQCAAVCPTGAIIPHQDREPVWEALHDPNKYVICQIAPAVRVAMGEYFGYEPGTDVTGKAVAGLKLLGFDQVYDTCFAADMTILEEGTEFLKRLENGGPFPMFTSCCPAWIKYVETYYPSLTPHLSSCKSPQEMFSAVARDILPKKLGIEQENLVVVSIMPCTAKKYEAQRPEFARAGGQNTDCVLTTLEAGRMMSAMGIQFRELRPQSFDMPMGFTTGAGVIFGNTGGVMEAALRYAVEQAAGQPLQEAVFKQVRGLQGIREAALDVAGAPVRVAVAHGLANARKICERVKKGEADYRFVEIMSCPGGCIAGAGQPIQRDKNIRFRRIQGLYDVDTNHQLHKSQENYFVQDAYAKHLGDVGGHKAHDQLHTHYQNRNHLFEAKMTVHRAESRKDAVEVTVTIGAQSRHSKNKDLLEKLSRYIIQKGYERRVDLNASFRAVDCKASHGRVAIGDKVFAECDYEIAIKALDEALG